MLHVCVIADLHTKCSMDSRYWHAQGHYGALKCDLHHCYMARKVRAWHIGYILAIAWSYLSIFSLILTAKPVSETQTSPALLWNSLPLLLQRMEQ